MTWKDRDKRKASFEKFSNIQSQSHKNNYTPHIENDAENPKNAITLTEYFDLHNDPNDLCMIRTIVFEYDVWFAGVDIVRVFYDSYYAGDVIRRVLTQSEYMLLPLSKVPRNLPEWSKTPQLYIVNQTGARKLFKHLMRNTRDIRDVQPMHAAVECFIYNAKKIISNLHGESVFKNPDHKAETKAVITFEDLATQSQNTPLPTHHTETIHPNAKAIRLCNRCNSETTNPEAKFCWKCGAEIKTPEQRLIDELQSICSLSQHVPATARDKFIRTINSAVAYIKGDEANYTEE